MTSDVRKTKRVKISLSCIFGVTQDTPRSGTVTSISGSGCFVKTKGWASKDQQMHLRLWLPAGGWLRLQGIVLYHLEGIGFGLLFDDLGPEDASALKSLIGPQALEHSPDGSENHSPE